MEYKYISSPNEDTLYDGPSDEELSQIEDEFDDF